MAFSSSVHRLGGPSIGLSRGGTASATSSADSARRRERLEARSLSEPERRFEPDPTELDRALAALRESDREVLMLVAWEGLGPNALAKALGCSKNAAVVRLHRARARLTAAWDERGER